MHILYNYQQVFKILLNSINTTRSEEIENKIQDTEKCIFI